MRGIGVVNLLHTSGEAGDFFPIDFRVYSPETDGKTKNEHFLEMLIRAKSDKCLKANTVLFDSWYSSVDNLKVIHRLGMVFISTLKSNRLVSTSKEQYQTSKEQNTAKSGKGKASVAYFPGTQILGLSKIPRIVDLFARRFQVQERLTEQVADAVRELIAPRAVVVRIQASHLCMMMRGVEKQSSHTLTEAERGMENLSETEKNRLWSAV